MEGFNLIGVPPLRNQWCHLRGFFSCVCVGVEPNGILILLTQSCLTNVIY